MRGAGEEEHEGEAGDAGEQVAQGEGEEKGGKQGVHLQGFGFELSAKKQIDVT